MKDLNDLRQERSAAATAMGAAHDTLAELEAKARPAGEDEAKAHDDAITAAQGAFDTAETEFKAADKAVKRAESVEAAQAASARSGDDTAAAPVGGIVLPGGGAQAALSARPKDPRDTAIEVGFIAAALANNRGDREKAVAQLDKAGHTGISAVLSGASDAAGGITIPEPLAEGVIDLLRPKVVVRKMGAETSPIPAGKMRHARLASGATASYGAEATAITASDQTFDNVDLAFKKLTALVGLSNDLIRQSSVAVARVARNDIVKQMAAREDIAFIRNDGTSGTPKGLRHWCPVANWGTEATAGAAAVEAFLRSRISLVEDADVAMMSCGWIMRASVKNWLAGLRDANSYPVYPSIDKDGTLHGYAIGTSSQIPDNLGGGSDSEIYFADFAETMIGDALTLTIATSDVTAYDAGGGNWKSAFQDDLTIMRAISEHDFAPMHDAAISGGTVTAWGT